ncbi:MAG: sigma-70 family RNA polymerase sigma factor [Ilumatobacteraceae bacterium]
MVPIAVQPSIDDIWTSVRALPDRQREVVVLRYLADLPEAEIAAALGVSRSAVSSALTDARRSLAVVLREPEGDLL